MSRASCVGFGERQAAIRLEHLRTERRGAHAAHGDAEARRGQIRAAHLRGLRVAA